MRINEETVSIVCTNYNQLGNLVRCIHSIKRNTDGNYNLIIVDRCSNDGSKEWLEQQEDLPHIILNKKGVCEARAINQGIKVSDTDWIVVVSVLSEIQDKEWLDKLWNYTIDRSIGMIEPIVTVGLSSPCFVATDFCLLRRKCINEIGLFDSKLNEASGLDFLIRLEWSRWRTAYCFDTNIMLESNILAKLNIPIGTNIVKKLTFKYSDEFLKETLEKNINRRLEKESLLICEEGTKTPI